MLHRGLRHEFLKVILFIANGYSKGISSLKSPEQRNVAVGVTGNSGCRCMQGLKIGIAIGQLVIQYNHKKFFSAFVHETNVNKCTDIYK